MLKGDLTRMSLMYEPVTISPHGAQLLRGNYWLLSPLKLSGLNSPLSCYLLSEKSKHKILNVENSDHTVNYLKLAASSEVSVL